MRAVSMATQRPPKILPLLGWLTGALFFFYAWVLRVAPNVISVGAAVLGNLPAAFFYGYAGMQVPVGVLLDRFGPRRLIAAAALLCAGGGVLFATADTLAAATTGRFLIGAAAAFSLVAAMAVAGQWFSADRFAMLSGLAMPAGMAGGVLGQAPLRVAVEAPNWCTSMLLLAGGLGLSLRGLGLRARPLAGQRRGRCRAWRARAGRAPSPNLARRAGRTWDRLAALGVCRAVGRAVPRHRIRAVAHARCDADVPAVRGLGCGRASVGASRPSLRVGAGGSPWQRSSIFRACPRSPSQPCASSSASSTRRGSSASRW